MGHLKNIRVGWENEHLATFLLSRISLVANPVTVGDDVGTDLFCTLFEIIAGQLFPRNSFAIQVKSSKRRINVTGKIEYLRKLELPFFVGVVNQAISLSRSTRVNICLSYSKMMTLRIAFGFLLAIPISALTTTAKRNPTMDTFFGCRMFLPSEHDRTETVALMPRGSSQTSVQGCTEIYPPGLVANTSSSLLTAP